VEEVRDRALPNHPSTISANLPTSLPGGGGTVALYVLQNGVTIADVMDSNNTNKAFDSEFCHDFTTFSNWTAANVPCGTYPAVAPATTASVAPYPLEYKWVRVTLKANNSTAYPVDPVGGTNVVCWDGISQKVAAGNTAAACGALAPLADPVYLVTALAVTPSGGRRLVQTEIGQKPQAGLPYGLFATGTGCASLKLSGGAQTYSFNSGTENPVSNPPSNTTASGGNVGSNGNVGVDGTNTTVNGTTGSAIGGVGSCNQGNGISATNGANYGSPSQIPVQNLPAPPMPNPLPPTKNKTYNNNQTLPPGSYGNVNITGNTTITLPGGTPGNPAVYTFNSFSLSSQSTLIINGPVIFNLAGVGAQNVLTLNGGFSNTTFIPSDFVINYGGTGSISLGGGAAAYAVINAPNANISFSGGAIFYGQAIGKTISTTGNNVKIYYDSSLNTPTSNTDTFYPIAMRELTY
jgi:hypothetical protein